MNRKRDIYKNISIYFLDPKNNNTIKNKKNPYYISLVQNKKEILNILQDKEINDIEVTIPEWEIVVYSIEWNEKKIENSIQYDEEKIPLKKIVLEILKKERSSKLEWIISHYVHIRSKSTIKEMSKEIRDNIYDNTEEIYDWIKIISYKNKYIDWDYKTIIESSDNFLEYITYKYEIYNILDKRLNEEKEKENLWNIIRNYIYEDIWIKEDISIYNQQNENWNHDDITERLFSLINDNISNKDITEEIIWDQELNDYIKKRSTDAYNYIRHNIDKIIENITHPSTTFVSDLIKKFNWNQRQQKFLYESAWVIEDIIKKIWSWSIRENINIFARLLVTIIDDKYVIDINQIK